MKAASADTVPLPHPSLAILRLMYSPICQYSSIRFVLTALLARFWADLMRQSTSEKEVSNCSSFTDSTSSDSLTRYVQLLLKQLHCLFKITITELGCAHPLERTPNRQNDTLWDKKMQPLFRFAVYHTQRHVYKIAVISLCYRIYYYIASFGTPVAVYGWFLFNYDFKSR
jgi:hypothetical protein